MDWDAFFVGLTPQGRLRAQELAQEFGIETASRLVAYYPVPTLNELENALRREREKVRTQVPDLYESIRLDECPMGWAISNVRRDESDGTRVVHSDVTGPNGASGFFERAFNARKRRIELRNAFLQLDGMTDKLPTWITGVSVPMVPARGTPTVQYFTLYQLKLLGVPAGRIRWWRRWLHALGCRSGPFREGGIVNTIMLYTIENVETILHLHWLRQRYVDANLSDLILYTRSVDYAETTAIQCGYRIAETQYLTEGENETAISDLLDAFSAGNPERQQEYDQLLVRYSCDRQTVIKQDFGIQLSLALG